MSTRDKRSTVLINKQFQIGQVAKFIAVHILALVIFGSLIYLFLDSELDSNLASGGNTYNRLEPRSNASVEMFSRVPDLPRQHRQGLGCCHYRGRPCCLEQEKL